ncbi:MAG: CDP-diacylglycerol--serine O-phosphatidyltransferase [Caldimicrobium sp.]
MYSLIPNIFTTLNLFSGFYSILTSIEGNFIHSAIAIFSALFFDIFDGRFARLTGQSTRFGKEYDSLADMVSFGVAPALLIYNFSLKDFSKLSWLACFSYMSCVALRLARFNTKTVSTTYFEGLPSPAGGIILSAITIFFIQVEVENAFKDWILLILLYLLAYLMVSTIKYPSFKELKFNALSNFYFLILFILMLTLVATNPPLILLIITTFYVLLGPFLFFKKTGSRVIKKFLKKDRT